MKARIQGVEKEKEKKEKGKGKVGGD